MSAFRDCAILLLFALCLRLATFGRSHGISPDEFFYSVVARDFSHVFSNAEYFSHIRRYDTLHAPGFPLTLSFVYFLTGMKTIEAARYFGLAFNVLTVPATYALVLVLGYSRLHAFTAAVLLSVVPAFWKGADRVWIDNPATFFVTLFWIFAIASLQRRNAFIWLAACFALMSVLLTKEYLLVPVGGSLLFGIIEPIRMRSWKFLGGGSLALILCIILGLYLLFFSHWLPQASYARAWLPQQQPHRGVRHEIHRPSLYKLYHQNAPESEVPALFWLLAVAGGVQALVDLRQHRERIAAVLALSAFAIGLILLISMARTEYGSRLLFPALPVCCAAASIALLDASLPVVPVIVPASAAFVWRKTSVWHKSMGHVIVQTYSIPFFWETVAAVSTLFLIAFFAHRIASTKRMTLITHASATCVSVILLFIMSGICVARGASDRGRDVEEIGDPSGLPAHLTEIKRVVKPTDIILSPNPRELAYYLDMNLAQLAEQGWLSLQGSEFQRLNGPEELLKRHVKWVVLKRPESSRGGIVIAYDWLKSLPYLEEQFKFSADDNISFVMFRVRPEKFPQQLNPNSKIENPK